MEKGKEQDSPLVRLRAGVETQDARHLALAYELANTGSQRIYVFAPPVYFGPHAVVQRLEAGAWVFHDGNHGVRLVCALLRPTGRIAARLPVVVIPVEAGAVYSGRMIFALPLVESHPYQSAEDNHGAVYSISHARLQIGWVETRSGVEPSPLVLADGTRLLQFSGSWSMPLQYVAEAVVPLSGVALRRHSDPFDRPMPAR